MKNNQKKSGWQHPSGMVPIILAAVLSFAQCDVPAHAQAVYGSVFGTVTDSSGAVVAKATVTVTDVTKGTAVTAQTNETGAYRVQHLIPDTYNVQAAATGFNSTVVQNVVVYADTSPEVNLQLAVGAVANTVEVAGGETLAGDRSGRRQHHSR